MAIENPITHKNGIRVGYTLTGHEIVRNALYGAAIGYLGGNVFQLLSSKWYSPQAGAVMGICAQVADFVPTRICSNECGSLNDGWNGYSHRESGKLSLKDLPIKRCLLTFTLWNVGWIGPLGANFFGYTVNTGHLVRYWAATLIVTYPLQRGIKTGLAKVIGTQAIYEHGIAERLTRRRGCRSHIDAKVSSDGLRDGAPLCPAMPDWDMLNRAPTFVELFTNATTPTGERIYNQAMVDTISSSLLTEQESLPGRAAPEVRHSYIVQRRLAAHISQMGQVEQVSILARVKSVAREPLPRRTSLFWSLLYRFGGDDLSDEGRVYQLISAELQSVKRAIFNELAGSVDLHPIQEAWIAFVKAHHDTLGLSTAEADDHDAISTEINQQKREMKKAEYLGLGYSPEEIEQRMPPDAPTTIDPKIAYLEAIFKGQRNEQFWCKAFKRRYTADRIVPEIRSLINENARVQQIVKQALIRRIEAEEGNHNAEAIVNATYFNAAGLNQEGAVLLLKLNGDLVNNRRLHTSYSNVDVLATRAN